jgi:predicted nucleotidyltransferase
MVDMKKIKDLTLQIAREFNPERIILFGSYAYGQPGNDSDVDILVVLPFKGKPVRKAIEIRNKVNAVVPLDLIVRTPEQVAERLAQNDWFMREIVERGRTLYEANHNGEKMH